MKPILILLLWLLAWPAWADTAPVLGAACATNGHTAHTTSNGRVVILNCTGNIWQAASIQVGESVSTCNAANEGILSYDTVSNTWSFCNGTAFVPFNSAAGTATLKTTTSSAAFFPTVPSCIAPVCASNQTSLGCSYGSGTALLNDAALEALMNSNLVTRMISGGFTPTCSANGTLGIGLFSKVICARLCKDN